MNPRRIKLAYVIGDLGYGGAQRQLSLLAPAVAAHAGDVDVVVACLSRLTVPFGRVVEAGGVPLTEFERRGDNDVSRLFALRRFFNDRQVDVIHAFSDASNIQSFVASRGSRVPLVTSLRSDRISVTGARARVLPLVFRRSDAVVTNSRAGRDTLVDRLGVRGDRVRVVSNIVEVDAAAAPVETTAERVGFVGRLVPLKRADRLIDAFAALGAGRSRAELVIVGEGTERDALAARAHDAGLDGRVTFVGTVEDARTMMRTFSCLVLPSSHEGLPNVVLEALASGIPVVASPVGDVPRLVDDGRTGLLVADESVEALSTAIARALTDDGLRRSARAEGPRFVAGNFSAERAVAPLLELYRSLV